MPPGKEPMIYCSTSAAGRISYVKHEVIKTCVACAGVKHASGQGARDLPLQQGTFSAHLAHTT
eukprot:399084-Pelagomonas_calceolata.AAC.2